MPLYQHRFSGTTATNENWMYTWWANSVRSLADAQAAAVTWNSTLWNGAVAGNGLQDHLPVNVTATSVTTSTIDQATGTQLARLDTPQVIPGTTGGFALPADVALVVSLRTALANRRGRGRFYLPQPDNAQVTGDGRVITDFIADVLASLSAAWGTYNTGLDRPVVYSRASRAFTNITTFDIGDLFDTQRRRENKTLEVRTSNVMP